MSLRTLQNNELLLDLNLIMAKNKGPIGIQFFFFLNTDFGDKDQGVHMHAHIS